MANTSVTEDLPVQETVVVQTVYVNGHRMGTSTSCQKYHISANWFWLVHQYNFAGVGAVPEQCHG